MTTTSEPAARVSKPSLISQLIRRHGGEFRHTINRFLARFSKVGNPAVFSPDTFPWEAHITANAPTIRAEILSALGSGHEIPAIIDVAPDHKGLDAEGHWRSFFLWAYGYRIDSLCARCPQTTAIVEQIPGLLTAMISVHEPGTHLVRHRGVTKGMVTAHLGLIIPDDLGCRMQVSDQIIRWREGELVVFDDTYEHEVWNETDDRRLVLLLHVRRPLRQPGRLLNSLFFWAIRQTAFVKEARSNILDHAARMSATDHGAKPRAHTEESAPIAESQSSDRAA
ncbi:MAG: aspartyl/asparaginyl beta-hydroxylase domain-containing protein [Pseudomonadota bacterium]